MKKFYEPDDGTQQDEKKCALCGTIDKKFNMFFEKVPQGISVKIDNNDYQIACWVCKKCKH